MVYLYELRQRNFGLITLHATPTPQLGSAGWLVSVRMVLVRSHFSIAALRAANSLQQFERNQLLVSVIRTRLEPATV